MGSPPGATGTTTTISAATQAAPASVSPAAPPPGATTQLPRDPRLRAMAMDLYATIELELAALGAKDPTRACALELDLARLQEERLGDPEAALRHYGNARRHVADSLPAIRGLRRLSLARGDDEPALKLYGAEIELTPESPARAALLVERALFLERIGKDADAAAALQGALALEPTGTLALEALAALQRRRKEHPALCETLVQLAAVLTDPHHRAGVLIELGGIYETHVGDDAAARKHYRLALEAAPDSARALAALTRLTAAAGEQAELAPLYARAAGLADDTALRHAELYALGHLQSERLRAEGDSVGALEEAVRVVPGDPLALGALADVHRRGARWTELAAVLRRVLAVQTEREERVATLCDLAEVVETRLGDAEDAMRTWRAALELDPGCLPALQALGRLYRAHGRHAERIEVDLADAERLADPGRRADLLGEAAEACEQLLGDGDRALDLWRRARAAAPGHPAAFVALDRLFAARQQWRDLADLYEDEAAQSKDPRRRVALVAGAADLWENKIGDAERAMATLKQLLAQAPENVAALQSLARLAAAAGRWKEVVDLCERQAALIADERQVCALLHRIGRLYEESLADTDRAVAAYRRVLERFPGYVPTHRALGRLFDRLGRWEDLIAIYERQIALGPTGPDVAGLCWRIGRLQESRTGVAEEAIRSYRRALQARPDHRPALAGLGRLHVARGEWRELAGVQEELAKLARSPERAALVWYRIGEIREERLGDLDGALAAHHEALKLRPGFESPATALRRIHGVRKEWSLLAAALADDAARAGTPGRRKAALLTLADLYGTRVADPQRAAACYEGALEIDPHDAGALRALAALYRRLKRWPDLGAVLGRLADGTSDAAAAAALQHERARLAETHGQEDAAPILEHVLRLAPRDPGALVALDRVYRARGEFAPLARVLEERAAVERDPAARRTLYTAAGDALLAAGQGEAARGAFRRALEEDPANLAALRALRAMAEAAQDHAGVASFLESEAEVAADPRSAVKALWRAAELRVRLRDPRGARADYERVLRLEPAHETAFRGLVELLAEEGDFGAYSAAFRARIAALGADRAAVGLRLELAETLERRLQDLAAAIAVLEEALALEPSNLVALEQLAGVRELDGRWPDAADAYERLLRAAETPDVKRRAALRLGALRHQRLGDAAGATAVLEAALAAGPAGAAQRDVLAQLVDVYTAEGDWRRAAAALGQLVEVAAPEERVQRLLELADVKERHLSDLDGARETLIRTLETAPREAIALARLVNHFERHRDPAGQAKALDRIVTRLERSNPRSTIPARIALARVLGEQLDRVGDAARQLEKAVQADATDPAPRLARARMHMRPPPRHEHAVRELRDVLGIAPWNAEAYKLLGETFLASGAPEKEACAAAAAAYVEGGAAPASSGRADEVLTGRIVPDRQLGYEAYVRLCAPREEPDAAREVLSMVEPFMGKLFPPDLGRFGVDRSARVPRDADHPLRRFAEEIAVLLGVEAFELYVAAARPIDIGVEPEEPPALVVGARVPATATPRELKFLLGRALSRVLANNNSHNRVAPREMMGVMAGIADQVLGVMGSLVPQGVPPDEARGLGKALFKFVSRKVKKALEEPVRRMLAAPPPDPNAWRVLAAMGACRAGLLCCGDTRVALEAMRRYDVSRGRGEPGPARVPEPSSVLGGNPYAEDLMRYSVSDEYFEARRKLGLAGRVI
jgi:tetratricopeptide (TPR) repeat protein